MARSFVDRLGRWVLTRRMGGMLTGTYEDLRRFVATVSGGPDHHSFGLASLLRTMERDIETESGIAALFARVGKELNPRAKQQLLGNLVYNWAVVGARRRAALQANDLWVPSFVVMSPTMRCNLKCTGCYSGLYSKRGELSEAEICRVLDECRSIGAYFVVVSGVSRISSRTCGSESSASTTTCSS